MPTPTIPDGKLFMNATLYTGNSGTQIITNGATGQSFQPDFVWLKSRSNALDHGLNDSVRGVQKTLASNGTGAENYGGTGELTAFNSNGFTLVNSGSYQTNQSGYTYVAWQWKAGGAAVTNTAGSISAQVSANPTAGFSVVTYTGTGSSATVGHGLGVAPSMIIIKPRNSVTNWVVGQASAGWDAVLNLNTTSATASGTGAFGAVSPTSSVFTVAANGGSYNTNQSTTTYVAYCFAEVAGYSKFGSYTGNGSADGPFVYLGFRPKFVLLKASSAATDWYIYDTSRDTYNVATLELNPNLAAAEQNGTYGSMDILSNGFKLRFATGEVNASSVTYIYACFAENPFKYANAR